MFDANTFRNNLIERYTKKVNNIEKRYGRTPCLAIVQVEGDKASTSYINGKVKVGEQIGINVMHELLNNNITQFELNNTIKKLSNNPLIDGVILQLPLPKNLNFRSAIKYLNPKKDVDGLTQSQKGKLMARNTKEIHYPCTALGVMKMLEECTTLEGRDIVIINRSELIGLPLSQMLMDKNATVTVCHSKTRFLKEKMQNADIIITGIGKANYFDAMYFENWQIVVDCSMNFHDGKLCGDVDLKDLEQIDDILISSGKGQTGPNTCLMLMNNTINAFYYNNKIKIKK